QRAHQRCSENRVDLLGPGDEAEEHDNNSDDRTQKSAAQLDQVRDEGFLHALGRRGSVGHLGLWGCQPRSKPGSEGWRGGSAISATGCVAGGGIGAAPSPSFWSTSADFDAAALSSDWTLRTPDSTSRATALTEVSISLAA